MNNHNDEFDRIITQGMRGNSVPEYLDQTPYGTPAQPVKPGLTKRGKAALGIGAAVIAGGSLIGYQVHSANVAENEAKAQEIALKAQALELEKMKELNRVAEANRQAMTGQEQARQASVDTCIKSHQHLVGKGYGSPRYRDIVDDCQDQYTPAVDTDAMAAASSQTAAPAADSGSVNEGLLIGAGALAAFVLVAAKRRPSNPTA